MIYKGTVRLRLPGFRAVYIGDTLCWTAGIEMTATVAALLLASYAYIRASDTGKMSGGGEVDFKDTANADFLAEVSDSALGKYTTGMSFIGLANGHARGDIRLKTGAEINIDDLVRARIYGTVPARYEDFIRLLSDQKAHCSSTVQTGAEEIIVFLHDGKSAVAIAVPIYGGGILSFTDAAWEREACTQPTSGNGEITLDEGLTGLLAGVLPSSGSGEITTGHSATAAISDNLLGVMGSGIADITSGATGIISEIILAGAGGEVSFGSSAQAFARDLDQIEISGSGYMDVLRDALAGQAEVISSESSAETSFTYTAEMFVQSLEHLALASVITVDITQEATGRSPDSAGGTYDGAVTMPSECDARASDSGLAGAEGASQFGASATAEVEDATAWAELDGAVLTIYRTYSAEQSGSALSIE